MSNATVQIGASETIAPQKTIIRGSLGGTFGKDELPVLKAWAEGFNEAIKSLSEEKKMPIGVLIDITHLETYTDPQAIVILAKLMSDDKPYVFGTATFGGSILHEMAEQIIKGLSGRKNLKNFGTEKEAIEWLKS